MTQADSVAPKSFSSPAMIITGMHRSGTSLMASLLHRLGVNLGERLLESDSSNPRGFYEDVDFYTFHQHALHTRRRTLLNEDEFVFDPTPTEWERAQMLIEHRAGQAVWGWKDPRTTLFLDFWSQLLPHARYLFVYRHPLEVLVSLVRRGSDALPGLLEGLQAWCGYNSRLANFYERRPDSCVLVHSQSALRQVGEFGGLLQKKLGLTTSLDSTTRDDIYYPAEFQSLTFPVEAETILGAIYPKALELYARLNALADLPDEPVLIRPVSSPEWAALLTLVTTLPYPHLPPLNRALLAALLALLAPSELEAFWRNYGQYIETLEQGNMWLEGQRANWQALTAEHVGRLQEQRTWIEKLQEAKIWLEGRLQEQRTQVEHLQKSNTWLEHQRTNWQTLVAERESRLQEQFIWIEKLQEGKTWLEDQRDHWQKQATEQQAYIALFEHYQRLLESNRLYRLFVQLKLLPSPPTRDSEPPSHA